LRPPVIEREHVAAEARLERRETIELVQDDIRHGVAAKFDDDAHAVAVGLVAQIGDALDALFAHEVRDLLDHGGLVHLIGNFGDDDGLAVLADLLDLDAAAHHDGAAAEVIGRARALTAEHDAAGRKIGGRYVFDEFVDGDAGIVDQRNAGVYHL